MSRPGDGPATPLRVRADTEIYSRIGRDEEGLRRLFRQFSFPGGIPSHAARETPGSIHEGGEVGYSLASKYLAPYLEQQDRETAPAR
jgi:phosphoketolase